jgi:hypothetical protein
MIAFTPRDALRTILSRVPARLERVVLPKATILVMLNKHIGCRGIRMEAR